MINKKGFTIVEVIVSFSLISLVLASLISTTMFYRDKVKDEEIKSQLWDYKNTITKLIYDDIIDKNIVRAESCIGVGDGSGAGAGSCVNFIDRDDNTYVLKIVEYDSGNNKGVYLLYDDIKYKLPDSDLSAVYTRPNGTQGIERTCDFDGGFDIDVYDNKLYRVKLSFSHRDKDIHHDIVFIVSQ